MSNRCTARELLLCGEEIGNGGHGTSDAQVKETQQGVTPTGASSAAAPSTTTSHWHGPIKPEDKKELRQVWQQLKETVEALPHVGCYSVASVAYRRQAACITPVLCCDCPCGVVLSSRCYSMLVSCAI